MDGLGVADNNG